MVKRRNERKENKGSWMVLCKMRNEFENERRKVYICWIRGEGPAILWAPIQHLFIFFI